MLKITQCGLFGLTVAAAVMSAGAAFAQASAPAGPASDSSKLQLLSAEKIWNKAPHNAFTDLIRYKDRWVCAFREAPKHDGGVKDSRLRLLTSSDGEKWEDAGALSDPRGDIRDAKLSITPDGNLMALTAIKYFDEAKGTHQTLAYFTDDLAAWDGPHDVGEPDYWMWGITWHKGVGYTIAYNSAAGYLAKMYTTRDGKSFETLVDPLDPLPGAEKPAKPNESAIVFDGDTAYCLLRAFGPAFVGTAEPPYTDWTWVKASEPVGGPELIVLPDGRLLGAGRRYMPDKTWKTSLLWVDAETGRLEEALQFPSGGDTSYPGMVLHDGVLHVSYYSSHEGIGKSSIYFARVAVNPAASAAATNP